MKAVGKRFGHSFEFADAPAGGCAIDACGKCLPDESLETCRGADAVLLGAVGGPKWDDQPSYNRPERALLGLRKALGLYANLRPAMVFSQLAKASPLKDEIISDGLDILIVRELTGGIYFGEHARSEEGSVPYAYDVEKYSVPEIERIARTAFDMASKRRGRVTSVDKANVLESSRLWRETVNRISGEYPDVELDHMYVDNAAMQLIRDPHHFDVLLTSNMFGDILSDEASQITGSIGMLPSASLADGNFGMYEPVHGSAPDIAGKNIANPIATILSCAMMMRYTLGLAEEADAVEEAVNTFLAKGLRTADIAAGSADICGTKETGDIISGLIG